MINQYVQGDILFTKREAKDKREGLKVESKVIALGKKTGHAHILQGPGDLFSWDDTINWLRAYDDVEIKHEEHGTLNLKAGDYEVIRQRVYDSKEKMRRPVVD